MLLPMVSWRTEAEIGEVLWAILCPLSYISLYADTITGAILPCSSYNTGKELQKHMAIVWQAFPVDSYSDVCLLVTFTANDESQLHAQCPGYSIALGKTSPPIYRRHQRICKKHTTNVNRSRKCEAPANRHILLVVTQKILYVCLDKLFKCWN